MTRRISLAARLSYAFDKLMARGPGVLVAGLTIVTAVIVFAGGAVIALTGIHRDGEEPLGLVEATWESMTRTLDPGNLASDTGWGMRWVMLVMTLAGIFIVAILIGVILSGMTERLAELRKGRSRVIESGHTVILNWSPSIFDVLRELSLGTGERRATVVVMAARDKPGMEDDLAAKLPRLRNVKVICRSGDPADLFDLSIVSPQTSKSIIVLSPEGSEDADASVLKTVLALTNDPDRRAEPYRIAAEMRSLHHAEVARDVAGSEIQLVVPDDLIARIVINASRQSGLSAVYSELLSFQGSEIYVGPAQPQFTGRMHGDALHAWRRSALIGWRTPDRLLINPPAATEIGSAYQPILIARDHTGLTPEFDRISVDELAVQPRAHTGKKVERFLILGWNRRGPIIARELPRYLAAGSVVTIASDMPNLLTEVEALLVDPGQVRIEAHAADPSRPGALQALRASEYDHVIVLSDSDHLPAQAADTRTLVTLLHLRKHLDQAESSATIVSEMVDVRNRRLAEASRADDFVVSNRLVSLMLAQASEQENLAGIFAELLDERGSEIVMRPMSDYVTLGRPLDFHTIVEAASRRGETAIGYCCGRGPSCSPVINPDKAEARAYGLADRLIVLAHT